MSKPKPVEQKIKKALKSKAAETRVDASPKKLAKILRRANGGNNK